MKIKKVTITGMHKVGKKSYTFNDGVTYFVGENGAGKSTILEAIQLGLLGYIPGYAKTNEAIMKHSSGLAMSVSLELEDGVIINRSWVRSGSSVKATIDTQNCDSKSVGDLIQGIEMPIFNFNEFKSMTANKLKEWFINFLPQSSEEFDLKDRLEAAAKQRSLPYNRLLNELMTKAEESHLNGIDLVRSMNSWIKEDQSFVKGQIAKLQSTIESLIHYDDAPVIDEDEIKAKIKELTGLSDKLARYESALSIYNRAVEAVNELKDSLPAESFSEDKRIADMESKIQAIKAEIEQYQKTYKDMQDAFIPLQQEHAGYLQEKASLGSINKDICPYTKTKCETIAKIVADSAKKSAEIDAKIAEVALKMNEARTEMNQYGPSLWQTKSNEIQQINSNIEFIRGQYNKLDALQQNLNDPGEKPTENSLLDIRSKIDELNKQLAMAEANKKFDELTDQVTKDKFNKENELEVLKIWEKLTGANGLQTELMNKPFENLANEMSTYLSQMFGQETKAQFNLAEKANSFSFGLIRDDSYIEFDYLSSGERCLFTLALIMCILDKSHSVVRTILIDDILDHLDAENSEHLFESLCKIDNIQFIMAGVKECKDSSVCKQV